MPEHVYVAPEHLQIAWQQMLLLLTDKVDKETGKGLSANDFTTELKTKLEGLTQGLTEQEVRAIIAEVVDSAPQALDTLKELATAINNDPDYATTVTTALAGKLDKTDIRAMTQAELDAILASS